MRNSENSSTRSKFAAVTRIGLLVLIFAVVFATVLSCGVFGESTMLNNGSVENVAEADHPQNASYYITSYKGSTVTVAEVQSALHNGGTYTLSTDLSGVGDSGGGSGFRAENVSGYKTTETEEGIVFWNGGSSTSWGINSAGQHWMYQTCVYAVLNVQIP